MVGVPLGVFAGEAWPHVEHALPFCVTDQAASLFVGSLLIVALYCRLAVIGMRAEVGVTATVMAKTVTPALPDWLVSDIEVAIMVATRSLAGGVGGAVYVTAVLVALLNVPAPDAGLIVHVTPWPEGS